ncbi:hypothetical protein GIB67_029363 [Kingdonia uniflora]|uniref:Uncharacterized protein n=1 Tax=Kingdonia uniflora TaxID=39325 RepID=A0A7J7NEH8_9MAGN|nr:hypothetical protein GIB67_029363 [Kingdonia uniflora]
MVVTVMSRYLNNNYLTGGVPAQLANLTNWKSCTYHTIRCLGPFHQDLLIFQIDLFGTALLKFYAYIFMYVDHNQFSGRIPDTFYKHPLLKEMYIDEMDFVQVLTQLVLTKSLNYPMQRVLVLVEVAI